MPKRPKLRLFQGANIDEMDLNFHGTIPAPWPIISTGFDSPGHPELCAIMQNPIELMSEHEKTLCPGCEVARFGEATKRERQGDNLTGKQNSSMTVGSKS